MVSLETLLHGYPVVVEIPVAWGEMDAFQHVNNIVYFRYFETARIAYVEKTGLLDAMQSDGIGPILATADCRFRFPLTYPDTVSVGSRVSSLGADRFHMEFIVVSHTHRRLAATGGGLIVTYNYREQNKAPVPASVRRRIADLEGWAEETEANYEGTEEKR